MAWWELEFGQESRASLDRLTTTIALLTTALKQNGDRMATAIDKLAEELTKFTATESTLATAVQAVAAALQVDAAKITDLTNQLAVANTQGNDVAIEALLPGFDAVADKLNADAATLQSAVPPATPPAQTP